MKPTINSYGTLTGAAFTSIISIPDGYGAGCSANLIRIVASAAPTFASWIDDVYPALSDKTWSGDPDGDVNSKFARLRVEVKP